MSRIVDPAFWQGRRVFMTGHTGFKGAWLSEWLLDLGAELTGYALAPPTEPSLFDQLGLAQRMHHIQADINDRQALAEAVVRADPEIVLHLAAQPLVLDSYLDPVGTYQTNVIGTAHLLEACRGLNALQAVVVVTTDKCYENREWHWGYREDEAMGGFDPYSSSKACTELVTAAYRRSFFACKDADPVAQIATARAGNVIGGGDWARDRLIPDAMRAFARGEILQIRYPESIRPWQHVLEPLGGYLRLAEQLGKQPDGRFAEGWNFGPADHDAVPVRQVLDRLCRHWPGAAWAAVDGDHPHEAGFLKLDCSKARGLLGWTPKLDLDTALAWTSQWYRAANQQDDLRTLTTKQIADYQNLN